MSDVFTLTIDGKDVAGNEGQTVMEVAEENGIDIPGLCHLEGITDRGACRLCMVEIAGSPKLAAACMTKIAEGMAITAHSDTLLEYRQSITEMMFMERNHVCAVCVANNHCELQNMADELGLKLTAMACFDTKEASRVFHKMHLDDVESGKRASASRAGLISFFDSHPPSEERYHSLLEESGEENRDKYEETTCATLKAAFLDALKAS